MAKRDRFPRNTSTYTKPHHGKWGGGRRHVDIYRTDGEGYSRGHDHSDSSGDMNLGQWLWEAFTGRKR